MSANKDATQNKIPRYIKSTVKIENPATAAPFPMSVKANKDATENKSSGSIKSTVKIEKPAAAAQFPKPVLAQIDPWKISSIQAAFNRGDDDEEEQKVEHNDKLLVRLAALRDKNELLTEKNKSLLEENKSLRQENKYLIDENMFLKRERATNAEKEHETIKSLESFQDKSQSCLQELRRTLELAKEHHKRVKVEAEEKKTETILKRG